MRRRRRLYRIVINTATVVSSALCVATVVLWVRSYQVRDSLVWFDGDVMTPGNEAPPYNWVRQIVSERGGVMVQSRYEEWGILGGWIETGHWFAWRRGAPDTYPTYLPSYASQPPKVRRWAALGIEMVAPPRDRPAWDAAYVERTWSITVPLWAATTVSGLLPALRAARWRRRRRRSARGLCPHCGYDLRATPARCPECGAVPPPPPPPGA